MEEVKKIISGLNPVTDSNRSLKLNPRSYERFFRRMVENRIQHCKESLKENLPRVDGIQNESLVIWDGGHFNVIVFEELVNSRDISIYNWSALVWQQVIRQMAREDSDIDPILYDIASQGCLIGLQCVPCGV